MKDFLDIIVRFFIVSYIATSGVLVWIGTFHSEHVACIGPWARFEYVVPAIRIGCAVGRVGAWLGEVP